MNAFLDAAFNHLDSKNSRPYDAISMESYEGNDFVSKLKTWRFPPKL